MWLDRAAAPVTQSVSPLRAERSTMKIYKVFRTDSVGWDEYDSAVVVAKNEQHAREIVAKEMSHGWGDVFGEHVQVELVNKEVEGVVVASFNAG